MAPELDPIVADADVLINLVATGVAVDILRSMGLTLLVPPAVASEVLFVESLEAGGPREQVDLAPLEQSGMLARLTLQDREIDLVIELAQLVDDGEAEAIAVGLNRNLAIATDDRKARRVAAARGAVLLSTPEFLHRWQMSTGVPHERMTEVLRHVTRRSHYRPPIAHPLLEWWMAFITG